MARRAGTVAVFTLGSRVLGYVRDAVLAHAFGAGAAFDAFVAAHTIPNALRRLVAEGTLMIAYVPLLTQEQANGGRRAMRRFTAAVLGGLLPLLAVIVGLGMAFPEGAIRLFAAGFEGEQAALAARLTRVMMPFLASVSLVAVAAGALNTVGQFAVPAAAPIVLNIGIVATVWGFHSRWEEPIFAAAWGVLVGGVAQLLLQLPSLRAQRLLVVPRMEWNHPALKELGRRTLPAVFGVGVYQLNIIIIRQIASFLPAGQMTCYFFASRLQEFALGVFAISISVAALPTLSEHAANKDGRALLETFRRALKATVFITVLAMAGLLVLAEPIVATLLRHGHFDAAAARMTAELVQIMALSLIPIGTVRVLVPTYYAFGDTRTPVIASTVSMLTTVSLGVVLGRSWEIAGLTVATAVAAASQVVILGAWLGAGVRRSVGGVSSAGGEGTGALMGHFLRCVGAMAPVALGTAWVAGHRPWIGASPLENFVYLSGLGSFMVFGYLGLTYAFAVPEARQGVRWLVRKLQRD